jgi:hypothetical protein
MTGGPFDFPPDEEQRPPAAPSAGDERERLPFLAKAGRSPALIAIVAAVVVLAYITWNTTRHVGEAPGARGPKVGSAAHPFAAPLAAGTLDGAVNVATAPDQGAAGKVAACDLTTPGSVSACRLWRQRPLAIVFFTAGGAACVRGVDAVASATAATPGVGVLAVAMAGSRPDAATLARRHGWRFPVAYDEDGRLRAFYGFAICPQITYVRRGGRVAGTTLGDVSVAQVSAQLADLAAGRAVRTTRG